MFNTATVARPVCVRPTRTAPTHLKCRVQEFGDYMLDVKGGSDGGEIGKVTVFTPTTSSLTNQSAKGLPHLPAARRLRRARALACKMEMNSMV